ncbi:MAG: tetratricopeptide repeat protein [Proteobacteria bacterium]|nr:tetratricopeptide repeat protein [Pseudomonadota bacterium]
MDISSRTGTLATTVLVAALIIIAILTYQRNVVWNDSVSLWGDVVAKSPQKYRAHYNLATVLAGTNDLDRALKENIIALELNPVTPGAHFNIGAIKHVRGDLDTAIQLYKIAISMKPSDIKAHNNLGVAYHAKGLTALALQEFNTALALDPSHLKTYLSRGNLYIDMDMAPKAYADYMRLLSYVPEHAESILGAGIALEMMGRIEEAGQKYRLASGYRATRQSAEQRLRELYSRGTRRGIRYE